MSMENSDQVVPGKRWSLLKAVTGGLLGGVPGLLCWLGGWAPDGGELWFSLAIGVLGVVIGVLLTRPGVSTRRVLKGTAVLMVAKAVPGPLRKPLYDELFREEQATDPLDRGAAEGKQGVNVHPDAAADHGGGEAR